MSSNSIQSFSHCQWFNNEQVSSPSNIIDTNNDLQDKFRLGNSTWRSRHHQQNQSDNRPLTSIKFYVDMDDSEDDDEEEEMEEDYSTTWSFSSFDEEDELSTENEGMHFVKKMDDYDNPIYTTTIASKKPISLLTQMLNGGDTAQQMPTHIEKKPLLKRCQSKYQSLSSWFATSAAN